MPAYSFTAPGKAILFGEHAVVYGRPAIAVPVPDVRAKATITPNPGGKRGQVTLQAPGIGLIAPLEGLPDHHPLAFAVRLGLSALGVDHPPAFDLRISSTIPVASGLGSGAAVSVAVLRAVSGFLGKPFSDERVCSLAYEVEKLYHGTPSGIDNTVITYSIPVYFVKGQPVERLAFPRPFTLVIADTGVRSPTKTAVGDVRLAWQADPDRWEACFSQIGDIVEEARRVILDGQIPRLGPLMNANHSLLQEMGISSVELDRLVETAMSAGALGAKLSGGGRGGNLIALAQPETAETISRALIHAGAVRTIITTIQPQAG